MACKATKVQGQNFHYKIKTTPLLFLAISSCHPLPLLWKYLGFVLIWKNATNYPRISTSITKYVTPATCVYSPPLWNKNVSSSPGTRIEILYTIFLYFKVKIICLVFWSKPIISAPVQNCQLQQQTTTRDQIQTLV